MTERLHAAWALLREADDLIQQARKETVGQWADSLMRVQRDISEAQTRLESDWNAHREGRE